MEDIEQIVKFFWLIVPVVVAVSYIVYVFVIRGRIVTKEKEILKVKSEIDGMMETVHKKMNGYINQSQLEAITKKNQTPLIAKLETLKMERKFLLDRISLLELLKSK